MRMKKYKVARRSVRTTTTDPVHQKHDKGYKGLLSKTHHFMHFLTKYIDADWVKTINENDLTLIDKTFIDADFKQTESDVIYKLKLKDREIIFYILLELQSSVDFTIPFRLLRYMTALLRREFRNTSENERKSKDYRLPAVVPIILYNGSDNWSAVRSFKEYLQGYEEFGDYLIDFKYLLFDLNRNTEETILSTEQLLDMVFALDKTKRHNMERIIKITLEKYRRMSDDDKEDLDNWMEYIWLSDIEDACEKNKILSNFKRGEITDMMSGLSLMIEEEVKKEKVEIAKSLLDVLDVDTIAKKTKLTVEEVEALKEENK